MCMCPHALGRVTLFIGLWHKLFIFSCTILLLTKGLLYIVSSSSSQVCKFLLTLNLGIVIVSTFTVIFHIQTTNSLLPDKLLSFSLFLLIAPWPSPLSSPTRTRRTASGLHSLCPLFPLWFIRQTSAQTDIFKTLLSTHHPHASIPLMLAISLILNI